MLPPEWIMNAYVWDWPDDAVDWFVGIVFCGFCGFAITPPYKCCWKDEYYMMSSIRIGISLMEWLTLIIVGILIDDDVIQDKTSYLFKIEHCLYFFIGCLICYVVFTLFPYLMPDLRLPTDIPIRSMHGYAFLGEQTELERLKSNGNNNFWDTPADDFKFLEKRFGKRLANAFSRLGYHSGALLSMQLNDEEIDLLYDKILRFDPEMHGTYPRSECASRLRKYHNEAKEEPLEKSNRNNKLAAIFALSNKQYTTN